MTTGISAPPIGFVSSTPSAEAINAMKMYRVMWTPILELLSIQTVNNTTSNVSPPVTTCCIGTLKGFRIQRSSCSLPNATRLPQNVNAPMVPETAVASSTSPVITWPPNRLNSSAAATKTEAAPPNPLNNATSCGICVICTRSAKVAPAAAPMITPAPMNQKLGDCADTPPLAIQTSVITTANSMPDAPNKLPRTAVFGRPICLRPMMNRIEATM